VSERRLCWKCEQEPPLPGRTIGALCRAAEKREARADRKRAQAPDRPEPKRAELGRNGGGRETQRSTAAGAKRPGPPLPDGWRGLFLAYLEARGTYFKAAKAAGVSDDTVLRERRRDPEFDRRVDEARQLHADQLEEDLTAEPGVVGKIVMLKKFRPGEFIERHAVLNLNVTSEIPGVDAVAMLRQMLADMSPATKALLEGQAPTVIDAPALPEGDAAQ
jgi:hypothetical protein